MVDPEKICFVCKDAGIEADTEFEGKPTHSWHLSEFMRTAMSSRAIEKEETEMGRQRRTDVDLAAFKLDYEAGMLGSELEKKYNLGKGTASKWARRAGCAVRGRGRRYPGSNGSHPHPKVQRKIASVAVKSTPVNLCVTEERLDRWWASLNPAQKGACFERGE